MHDAVEGEVVDASPTRSMLIPVRDQANCLWVGIVDLFGVRWLIRRAPQLTQSGKNERNDDVDAKSASSGP
jgi:hypothetical protein